MGNVIGGGGGGIFSAIGGIVGTIFGGPIGAMIGQMIGGMVDQAFSGAMDKAGVDSETKGQAQNAYRDAFREASGGMEPNSPAGNGSIHDQIDRFSDAANASPADRGRLQQLSDELQKSINDMIAKGSADAAGGAGGSDDTKAAKGKTGGSWLMAIAKALGEAAGKSAAHLTGLANELSAASDKKIAAADGGSDKEKEVAAQEYNQKNVEFQGASQEFNLLMQTVSTALKTLGESMGAVARKQ